MKKVLFLLAAFFTMSATTLRADDDKPIRVSQMPQAAQQFIKAHFPDSKVSLAKMDDGFLDKSYEVIFTNGTKVEFDKKGRWTEVNCKSVKVPNDVIPAAIRGNILRNYPSAKIVKIERQGKGYEVKLDTGLEVTYNSKLQLVDIDD